MKAKNSMLTNYALEMSGRQYNNSHMLISGERDLEGNRHSLFDDMTLNEPSASVMD